MSSPAAHTFPGSGSFLLSEEKEAFKINAAVYELGSDCLVILWGGTKLHIGAVGMAQTRPSLRDPGKTSATSSVYTYPGHKEDTAAKTMSEEIARKVGRNTVVVAGMHWDGLSEDDISIITAMCSELTDKIVSQLIGLSAHC